MNYYRILQSCHLKFQSKSLEAKNVSLLNNCLAVVKENPKSENGESIPDEIVKLREKIKDEREKSKAIDEEIKLLQDQIFKEKQKMKGITPQEKHSKLVKEVSI